MSKHAYCSGCGAYVALEPGDVCPQAHPRSMLRDIREGAAPQARSASAATHADPPLDPNEMLTDVIAKTVVIVPALLLLGIVVFFSVAQSNAMGLTGPMMWLSGIGSAAVTILAAFGWGMYRRRKKRG